MFINDNDKKDDKYGINFSDDIDINDYNIKEFEITKLFDLDVQKYHEHQNKWHSYNCSITDFF